MANVIKIKRGTGANPTSLAQGELAIREDTNELFYGKGTSPEVTKLVGSDTSVVSFQTSLSGLTPSTPTKGAVTLGGTLGVSSGGTGSGTGPNQGGIIYGSSTTAYGSTAAGSSGQVLISAGTGAPTWSSAITVTSGNPVISGSRSNFNLGGTGKSGVTPSNGDFWWEASTNTLKFYPNSTAGTETLAFTDDIKDGTLTIATSGTGLSVGSPSTFSANQSGNATITITSNANTANGANTIVARDGSGNFAAGTITAALNGNASTATSAAAWTTARTITLSGDLTGNVSINGSQNVTLDATIAANSVALGTDTTGNYVATIAAGTGMSVSGSGSENAAVTVSNNDRGSSQNIFKNVAVSGQTTVVADSNDDTLTFAAGTGITLTTNATTDTVTIASTTYTAGTGLSLAGTVFSIDSTVLTNSSTIDGGTY